jgi:hypothetical protein
MSHFSLNLRQRQPVANPCIWNTCFAMQMACTQLRRYRVIPSERVHDLGILFVCPSAGAHMREAQLLEGATETESPNS